MNILDEEESFYATREGFTLLCDIEWTAIERMSSNVGEIAISAMFRSLNRYP